MNERMVGMNIENNEQMKFVTMKNSYNWKYGYRVLAQRVRGKLFVTFVNDFDRIHFNDSHSICISEFYGKKKALLEMIEYAESLGW